jgi:serine/threonine protein kinase
MTLSSGTRLGPYEILSSLGAGGMGEVYRARDTRLARDVGLKILPADLAADPSRRQRFELEARAVAALNHPNIVALYDVAKPIVTDLVEASLRANKLGLKPSTSPSKSPTAAAARRPTSPPRSQTWRHPLTRGRIRFWTSADKFIARTLTRNRHLHRRRDGHRRVYVPSRYAAWEVDYRSDVSASA